MTLGVGATDGAGVAGGRVGMSALLPRSDARAAGALVAPLLLQAARKAPSPAAAVPCRKRRRVRIGRFGYRIVGAHRSPSRGRVTRSGRRAAADDECVLGEPGQANGVALSIERALAGSLDVLLVDGHRDAALRLDDVLGADADVRHVADGAFELVGRGRDGVLGPIHADLLGPDADLDPASPSTSAAGTRSRVSSASLIRA